MYYTGAYLGPFLRPVTDLLETLAEDIGKGENFSSTSLRGQYQNANVLLWQQICDLALPTPGGTHFAGSGATAFSVAAQQHLRDTNSFMGTFKQVETALSAYINTVITESNREDEGLTTLTSQLKNYCAGHEDVEATLRMLLPQGSVAGMIKEAIGGATVDSVIQDGPTSNLLRSLERVYWQIQERGDQYFQGQTQLTPEIATPPAISLANQQQYVTIATDLLYRDVSKIFGRWSDMLQQTTSTLLQTIMNQEVVKPNPNYSEIAFSSNFAGMTPLLLGKPSLNGNGIQFQFNASGITAIMSDGSLQDLDPSAFAMTPLATPFSSLSLQNDPPPRRGTAAMRSISRSVLDQPVDRPASLTVFGTDGGDSWVDGDDGDPISDGWPIVLLFHVRSGIQYTIDIPTNQPVQPPPPYVMIPPGTLPAIYPPPVIHNIIHWVDVIDGRDFSQPFTFNLASSVDIFSGDGTYLRTAVGSPDYSDDTSGSTDWQIALKDPTPARTTVPFPPPPNGQDPTVLFILQHNVYVAVSGTTNGLTPPPPYYQIVAAFSPNDDGPANQGD